MNPRVAEDTDAEDAGNNDRRQCSNLFRPRDPAEVEAAVAEADRQRAVSPPNPSPDRHPLESGGSRLLDPDTIDRAMSRSAEATAAARRVGAGVGVGSHRSIDGPVIKSTHIREGGGSSWSPSPHGGGDPPLGPASGPASTNGHVSHDGTWGEFRPNPDVESRAATILTKAERAHHRTHQYERAIGYYLAVLSLLSKFGYPDNNPLISSVLKKLNDCHHAQSSLRNSANIVKMGIKHENRGEFVRALKMYTIAYRIRRDALGKFHPSLPVLLNMLGSVQVKRAELKEAMQIYELALNGRPDDIRELDEERRASLVHPSTKAVTLRDMGMIHERWGDDGKALRLYRESLDYVVEVRERERGKGGKIRNRGDKGKGKTKEGKDRQGLVHNPSSLSGSGAPQASGASTSEAGDEFASGTSAETPLIELEEVKFIRSHQEGAANGSVGGKKKGGRSSLPPTGRSSPSAYLSIDREESREQIQRTFSGNSEVTAEKGEMELYINSAFESVPMGVNKEGGRGEKADYYYYDTIFPPKDNSKGQGVKNSRKNKGGAGGKDSEKEKNKVGKVDGASGNDVNVAMTLHQIAQIYRRQGQYAAALSAYQAALRGMCQALGDRHPNVAAILGNLGNLHKEMGDFDQAYDIYQKVLGIETLHLGATHPEVSVTLHNIATIESSRGRYADAIDLYARVVKMQKTLFGPSHISVAVTSSCMGDVYERMGNDKRASEVYEDSMTIRTNILGHKHVDVGRLMHKLGSLAQKVGDYSMADEYLYRAASIYESNEMEEHHPWVRDMERDRADIQAHLSLGVKTDYQSNQSL